MHATLVCCLPYLTEVHRPVNTCCLSIHRPVNTCCLPSLTRRPQTSKYMHTHTHSRIHIHTHTYMLTHNLSLSLSVVNGKVVLLQISSHRPHYPWVGWDGSWWFWGNGGSKQTLQHDLHKKHRTALQKAHLKRLHASASFPTQARCALTVLRSL